MLLLPPALDGSVKEALRKLLKQGYRLVYQIEEDTLVVLVLAIARREDSLVYRLAVDRLGSA
ncbi:MAG: type II toxin-antitoxin system RelE/ParE family toxin [Methylococcaceae bacterium]|nr:type II toxin-antitoxin system RelE/ParE family toxin [Methylococcaceae bacterium]